MRWWRGIHEDNPLAAGDGPCMHQAERVLLEMANRLGDWAVLLLLFGLDAAHTEILRLLARIGDDCRLVAASLRSRQQGVDCKSGRDSRGRHRHLLLLILMMLVVSRRLLVFRIAE